MAQEVIWTEPAVAQLDAIADYIALDKPEAARAVVRKVFAATDDLRKFKALGKPVPEFRHPAYRQLWVAPVWIYYRVERSQVVILHVRRAERPLRVEELVGD